MWYAIVPAALAMLLAVIVLRRRPLSDRERRVFPIVVLLVSSIYTLTTVPKETMPFRVSVAVLLIVVGTIVLRWRTKPHAS
jgi:hypothetical protein